MKKIYFLTLVSYISITIPTSEYIFNHQNPRGCNFAMRDNSMQTMTIEQNNYIIENEHNNDDNTVAHYAASFTKTLEHDSTTSVLTPEGQAAYKQLLIAINTATKSDFNAISRAPQATRGLVSPQAAYTRSLMGIPAQIIPMPSAPTLISEHAAAEIIEVYLKAICRDVFFDDYGTGNNSDSDPINGGSKTNNAAAIMTALGSHYKGPINGNGTVTVQELFRGTSPGDLVGPYISQFWFHPTGHLFQNVQHVQQVPIAQQREFGVTWNDFIAIQNGAVPKEYDATDFNGQRYISNGRDAGTAVHNDGPGEFFINAAHILLQAGAPLSQTFPYTNGTIHNEEAFVNMAGPDIATAVLQVFKEALKHAWNHKWRANRRLRPEAMAGLIHQAKITNNNAFNMADILFQDLAGIDVLNWVQTYNTLTQQSNTYLLSQMYPEGSPTHPSYPAGHATVAGACTTVLKAFFDNDATLISFGLTPVKPDPNNRQTLIPLTNFEGAQILTIAGELDKLASNAALSRDFAGVHYRSDGDEGILLGEQVALHYLQDHARMYTESDFTGFTLTKRNGDRVLITPDTITILP